MYLLEVHWASLICFAFSSVKSPPNMLKKQYPIDDKKLMRIAKFSKRKNRWSEKKFLNLALMFAKCNPLFCKNQQANSRVFCPFIMPDAIEPVVHYTFYGRTTYCLRWRRTLSEI